jgi:hypothetical protein
MNGDEITLLEEKLSKQYAEQFGYKVPDWNPLLEDS